MIERKTVLVLGAGASKPYGFPLGYELTWEIKKVLLNGTNPRVTNAIRKACDEKDVWDFCHVFSHSGQRSIDNFLAHSKNPDHWKIGKLLIAAIIKHYESETILFDRSKDDDDHWYEYLWERLSRQVGIVPWEDFHKNQLSVITFNYDRSLETYLTTVMGNTYGKSKEE